MLKKSTPFGVDCAVCTKLRIKDLLRYDSYNNIELKFRNSLETDNIPEVKIYFSSEENSCED